MSEAPRTAATWLGDDQPAPLPRPSALGWALVVLRGLPIILTLVLGVLFLLPLRLIERLFTGPRRPVTGPWVQGVCRICLFFMGLRWRRVGRPMKGAGAAVANHASWLDILVLNAAMPVFFVSKSEVASWPGINILTRVTNTHFVTRDPKLARQQAEEFAERTRAGHRLLFFPEGTSSDSQRVLPFKPTLFQGFLDPALPPDLAIQPVTACYQAPPGEDPRFYGWWGNLELGPHLLAVLSRPRQGAVTVILHPPIPVAGESRKTLSAKAEAAVRSGFLPDPKAKA
ncbi:lysophospholipid acyltransferase family protein [Paracoccus aminophilus]|uniref:1-acyl-sn-glycerol-3-phosphate acyltransferase n=1 Tax=Paracoccus aminophilus JCM 7686 TaxID=1367847 RepID=S5Y8V1_PARAH|nr:lysophospholipid acyltransferase family protein [Paracoccus aminophilus]AGT07778.1 1-acyl-sn-glycerol-3-phosphate acyltransferase [Paracoccus aminophilus JCM 7686]